MILLDQETGIIAIVPGKRKPPRASDEE